MKITYDAICFLKWTFERPKWSTWDPTNPSHINPSALTTQWENHHDRGWYYYLIEKNVDRAKQEFYTCGLLDGALNKVAGHKTAKEMGQSPWNSMSLDSMSHLMDVLYSDNIQLFIKRIRLNYPEREQYIFKDKYDAAIIIEILHNLFKEGSESQQRIEKLVATLPSANKAKEFGFDRLFIDGILEGNPSKMQEGIEGVASLKVHKRRQTQDETKLHFRWDNMLLSHFGIVYTKIAWMRGYELDIQAPLVRITKDLWPVKPLESYDSLYDFLLEKSV